MCTCALYIILPAFLSVSLIFFLVFLCLVLCALTYCLCSKSIIVFSDRFKSIAITCLLSNTVGILATFFLWWYSALYMNVYKWIEQRHSKGATDHLEISVCNLQGTHCQVQLRKYFTVTSTKQYRKNVDMKRKNNIDSKLKKGSQKSWPLILLSFDTLNTQVKTWQASKIQDWRRLKQSWHLSQPIVLLYSWSCLMVKMEFSLLKQSVAAFPWPPSGTWPLSPVGWQKPTRPHTLFVLWHTAWNIHVFYIWQ